MFFFCDVLFLKILSLRSDFSLISMNFSRPLLCFQAGFHHWEPHGALLPGFGQPCGLCCGRTSHRAESVGDPEPCPWEVVPCRCDWGVSTVYKILITYTILLILVYRATNSMIHNITILINNVLFFFVVSYTIEIHHNFDGIHLFSSSWGLLFEWFNEAFQIQTSQFSLQSWRGGQGWNIDKPPWTWSEVWSCCRMG